MALASYDLGSDITGFVDSGTERVYLSYDANGGSGSVEADYLHPDSGRTTVKAAPGAGLSLIHFAFSDWNTDPKGRGRAYAAGDAVSLGDADLTLYAQWAPTFVLAAGERSSFFMDDGGTLWAWGNNDTYQLGDGSTTSPLAPVRISAISQVSVITAGYYAGLALKPDGSAWTWGRNDAFELGTGNTNTAYVAIAPVQVLSGVAAIASGDTHFLAVKTDGTAWAWGSNGNGQLGNGGTDNSATPVQVLGGFGNLTDVVAVAASTKNSLALKADGTVWGWGYNTVGQLGDGGTTTRSYPLAVTGLTDVVAIDAGYLHSLALKADGTVWAWGNNASGELGDGGTSGTQSYCPVRVSLLSDVVAISAGYSHGMALDAGGTVWTWGLNSSGQLGDDGASGAMSKNPVAVSGLSDVIAISSGFSHCLAFKKDGTVWAWGSNSTGRLGDGSTTNRSTPVKVAF